MATTHLSDKAIIDKIGVEALTASGFTDWQVKQWRQRGIAWSARAEVAELAEARSVEVPADFLKKRRPAPKKRKP